VSGYLLIAAVGGPNFGDEAILSAWINEVKRLLPNGKIYCDGYNIENAKKFISDRAFTLELENSLWDLIRKQYKYNNKSLTESVNLTLRDASFIKKLNFIAYSLKKLNIQKIHICGGGYFNKNWPHNYLLLQIAYLIGEKIQASVVATGQGLTPVDEEGHKVLNQFSTHLDHIDCRENYSLDLLLNNKNTKTMTGDDALLFFAPTGNPPIHWLDKKSLVICIQSDLFNYEGFVEELIKKNINFLSNEMKIEQIILAEAMLTDIINVQNSTRTLLAKLGIEIITMDRWQLLKDGFPLSKDGLVITSRYHPHFFAALSGVRGIAIYSNDYYRVKHEAVCAMGSNWQIKDCRASETLLPLELRSANTLTEVMRPQVLASLVQEKISMAEQLILFKPKPQMPSLYLMTDRIAFTMTLLFKKIKAILRLKF
jgi:polysaccharide pyruvyl transferase WcaK-like protein